MYKSESLLSIGSDSKTIKGQKYGYLTGILYLAPSTTTKYNTCPMAEIAQCADACLYSAGRGAMSNVKQSRINKTIYFYEDRQGFMNTLVKNINSLKVTAKNKGLIPLVRLNGTSDIKWENIEFTENGIRYNNIFDRFPELQFYDYTKTTNRTKISNYDLTYSYSGVLNYQKYVTIAKNKGMRIAVVFRSVKIIPKMFIGLKVISGDNSDIRHLDDHKVIVALYAKGQAKKDNTGFVVDNGYQSIPLIVV